MNFLVWILIIFVILNKTTTAKLHKYSPTWESLDSRPLPNWYDEAKVGMFVFILDNYFLVFKIKYIYSKIYSLGRMVCASCWLQ